MELQFHKTQIPYLRTALRETQNQEQTQEVRLADGMPDVGHVLSCWGQVLIRGKEWRSGGISVSGGVMVWVLYAPEDGSEPQCVETWLPFQTKWDFQSDEQDGTITVQPLLRNVDARSTSARKLMVRANVGILAEALCADDAGLSMPDTLPEDICILKNTYPMCLPMEAGEKAFTLEETLSLPASMPTPVKLIRYELRPELTEEKILADKLVFRGTAIAHILYCGIDGQLYNFDFEVPFSQYAELDREYTAQANAKVCMAVTNLEIEQGAEENLILKAGLTGQYTVYDSVNVEVIEDAYSPKRQVVPENVLLYLPEVLDFKTEKIHAESTMESDSIRVADTAFYPNQVHMFREGEKMVGELSGTFQMLSYDENGKLKATTNHWEDSWNTIVGEDAKVEVFLQPVGKYAISSNAAGAELKAELLMNMQVIAEKGIPMVTGLELGEIQEPDPNRPSLILCRMGTQRLWDVAKRTGSTMEAIQKANDLQKEPESNRILLIPVL